MLVVFVIAGLLAAAAVSKVLDARNIRALEDTGDSLRLEVAATNVRLEAFTGDSARFAAQRDSFDLLSARLTVDVQAARGRSRVAIVSRDSARATVQIDTLTPALRSLIVLEREAAVSFQQERDLERELRISTEAQLAAFRTRLAAAEALLFTITAERDTALSLVSRHEARLEFNLFRWFGEEIPQLLACSAGGAIVAVINDGDLLIGAGIGLAACVVKEAIF